MNPLFGNIMPMMGGMNGGQNKMFQMIQTIRQAQQNPNMLADMLFNNGKINQSQYDEIKKMNGNPQMIGQYLIQSGTMPQNEVQQAYSSVVPQITNELNKAH